MALSLNSEIQQLLAGFSIPADVSARIAEEMARIDASGQAPGLALGERAPDFTLPNDKGAPVSLSGKLRRGPVVLTFFRGAWCPFCSLQVAALHRAMPEIRAAGGSLIGVHPDTALIGGHPTVDFDLVTDAKQDVIRAYRLHFRLPPSIQRIYAGVFDADVSQHNADGSWDLPVPGSFIIDPQGVIRRRHVTADFLNRMEPADVVEALEEIDTGGPVVN